MERQYFARRREGAAPIAPRERPAVPLSFFLSVYSLQQRQKSVLPEIAESFTSENTVLFNLYSGFE